MCEMAVEAAAAVGVERKSGGEEMKTFPVFIVFFLYFHSK